MSAFIVLQNILDTIDSKAIVLSTYSHIANDGLNGVHHMSNFSSDTTLSADKHPKRDGLVSVEQHVASNCGIACPSWCVDSC